MSNPFALYAQRRIRDLWVQAALRSVPLVVVATVATPIVLGVELSLIRSDRAMLVLLGVIFSGLHALVLLSSIGYLVAMGREIRLALRGDPGKTISWARLERSRDLADHSRLVRVVTVVLAPFNWANPVNPVSLAFTHVAFALLWPRLRLEASSTGGPDPETLPLFPSEETESATDEWEHAWRKVSATGARQLVMSG